MAFKVELAQFWRIREEFFVCTLKSRYVLPSVNDNEFHTHTQSRLGEDSSVFKRTKQPGGQQMGGIILYQAAVMDV